MGSSTTLAGSGRGPLAGARAVGKADAGERLEVTVVTRRRGGQAFAEMMGRLHAPDGAAAPRLSRAEYANRFGADPDHFTALRKFAAGHGLTVAREHLARRTLVLAGTVAQFNAAFGIDLQRYEHPGGAYRGYAGNVQLPAELQGMVESVLGLDSRPQARPHFRIRPVAGPRLAGTPSFTPLQLAGLYGFPSGDGKGQTIALIELGGGFTQSDLTAYFSGLGLASAPRVSAVSVDGTDNAPNGNPNGPDGEVMLDIEVAGAVAPAAQIVVYFAPNTDAGFLAAITTAIHDTTHTPSVVSISWGSAEAAWTQQALTSFDQAFQEAATLGVSVTVAAGDNGSGDGLSGDHVDFPASSPHVLACGGTRLQAGGGAIGAESVWNDGAGSGATGGGISAVFGLPAWQSGLSVQRSSGAVQALAMRGVPDVAGDADPQTGYAVRVGGQDLVFGGTSAVAPLWAGLLARINGARGRAAGFVNAALYAHGGALRDITQGNNGDFAAAKGWDACTGLGSPDGTAVQKALGT